MGAQWTIDGRSVEYLDAMRHTQWFNTLAAPAAVVPVGRSPEGLPIGVQIVRGPSRMKSRWASPPCGRGIRLSPPPMARPSHPFESARSSNPLSIHSLPLWPESYSVRCITLAQDSPSPPFDGGAQLPQSRYTERFPENWRPDGALRVRESWQERFAESPDVLIGARRGARSCRCSISRRRGRIRHHGGPCSVETERQLMATAHHVRSAGARVLRGGAFKPRSSPYSFQGLGLEGLKLLAARASDRPGHRDRGDVGVRRSAGRRVRRHFADRLAQHGELLAAGSGGAIRTADSAEARHGGHDRDLLRSAQVVLGNGNPNVILCERGIRTFETAMRNTFDAAGIALLKQSRICR
jgi:hypothetical protein